MIQLIFVIVCFFFKKKTAYEMRISDWSSDVCSSDLLVLPVVSQWRERYLWLAHLAIAQDRHGVVRDALGQGGITLNRGAEGQQIGRASCRERVCQYE